MATSLPASSTSFTVNIAGNSLAVTALFYFSDIFREWPQPVPAICLLLIGITPTLFYDSFRAWKRKQLDSGKTDDIPRDANRILTKWFGLNLTLIIFLIIFLLLPEYNKNDEYNVYRVSILHALPFFVLGSFPYFWWCDNRADLRRDGYWHVGNLIMSGKATHDWHAIGRHLREWLVKAFFLPLMFVGLNGYIHMLLQYGAIDDFLALYTFLYTLLFCVDLLVASAGYMMTFRVLDTHIRSTDPTVFGWLVAVICYAPFWNLLLYNTFLAYEEGYYWHDWLSGSPVLSIMWGSACLLFVGIYLMSNIAQGYRFSNLTYRGIVTTGPFRYSKHPCYIAKNIAFWLIAVPFVSDAGIEQIIRGCVLLFGVNCIYFFRAKTEESHLWRYPEYREYAAYIEEHGLFRWVGRLLPFTKWRP